MIEDMAVVHMSETDVVKDIVAVLAKVRQGSEIVVEQCNRPVAVIKPTKAAGRMISEVIAELKARRSEATMDDDFARDIGAPAAMESPLLGIILDSSILIAAERRKMTPDQVIESVQQIVGEVPIALCSVTVAEIAHGIYRADSPETRNRRRKFLDDLKATVPIHPITEITAEIVAQVGGEQAANGINLPLGDLIIEGPVLIMD